MAEAMETEESKMKSQRRYPLRGHANDEKEGQIKTRESLGEDIQQNGTDDDSDDDEERELFEEEEKELLKGPTGAAIQSRLPTDQMSDAEAEAFKDLTSSFEKERYILLRNFMLEAWLKTPNKELTLETVWKEIIPSWMNIDQGLVSRVFAYLNRFGYINFGPLESRSSPAKPNGKKIIVIGAGIAGLVAALQLKRFGFEVVILEAGARVGGRICTYQKDHVVADLGAMIVPGLGGNPLLTLSKQMPITFYAHNEACPLYEPDFVRKQSQSRARALQKAPMLSKRKKNLEAKKRLAERKEARKERKYKEVRMEIEFNKLLEAACRLSDQLESRHGRTVDMSLGEAIEWIIGRQERDVKTQYQAHLAKRSLGASEPQQDLECVGDKKKKEYAQVYLTSQYRQILDWHLATLEYRKGASLSKLSLQHWDQDEDYEFFGKPVVIREGFSCIPFALSKGLEKELRLNTVVREIDISLSKGVKVVATSATSEVNEPSNFYGDAVLCTLPLGVLRHSLDFFNGKIINKKEIDFATACQLNAVRFTPPLPSWKCEALERVGCGTVNKVVLVFNSFFWDRNCDMFGNVPLLTRSRGELFLFWSLTKAPVLIALVVGEAAEVLEEIDNEYIKARCVAVLKHLFGDNVVPDPEEMVVTRWKNNPLFRGSHSFVAVGASGNDFDLLAAPVGDVGGQEFPASDCAARSENRANRLYFGGEHTICDYNGTVHGALLSGLREAGRIADELIGRPYDLGGSGVGIDNLFCLNGIESSDDEHMEIV